MNCEAARPQLEAYLDGELDRSSVDALEGHLATCAACRGELASLEELRTALRALPAHHAPADLRARLAAVADLPVVGMPRSAPRTTVWRMAAAVSSGIAAGVLLTIGASQWNGAGRGASGDGALLARDLLASHLRALAASSAVDVVSEDRHTVKPWFAGKIGVSPPVVDLQAEDFPLLGGRIDYVADQRTAVIVYGHRKHVIDVFMAPGAAHARASESQGHALTPCVLAGQSAWIVSDIDADSLRRFRSLLGCGA
ncbi:MAG TPA: zf-HC2 domain-containing protein [Steroidobacteraceae bacterium]|nr:zf-HC2 domain-containing protein [Steroidobacteraceae bacterium]